MSAADTFALTSPVTVGGRESHDHFPTPRPAILSLLAARPLPRGIDVFDPACGEGAILNVVREQGHRTFGIELDVGRATAARERGHQVDQGDAFVLPWRKSGALLANPPFTHALAFASVAHVWLCQAPRTSPRSRVCMLLRLTFVDGAGGRAEFLRRTTPDMLVLSKRPAYDGRGTDSVTSAWFCWPGTGRYEVLP